MYIYIYIYTHTLSLWFGPWTLWHHKAASPPNIDVMSAIIPNASRRPFHQKRCESAEAKQSKPQHNTGKQRKEQQSAAAFKAT